MRGDGRWCCLEIHAHTGTQISNMGHTCGTDYRGEGERGGCKINTAAQIASQHRIVLKDQFYMIKTNFYSSSFSNSYSSGGGSTAGQISVLVVKVSHMENILVCMLCTNTKFVSPFGTEFYVHVLSLLGEHLENCFFLVLDYVFALKLIKSKVENQTQVGHLHRISAWCWDHHRAQCPPRSSWGSYFPRWSSTWCKAIKP